MTTPRSATDPPTIRKAVAQYIEHLTAGGSSPDRVLLVAVALHALFEPAMEECVHRLTPLRLVLLGGLLKQRVSPKTGRQLAASTFRRYMLLGQPFAEWCTTRWLPAADGPAEQQGTGSTGKRSGQHLGDLIRILRTDAGLARSQLGDGTRIGALALKRIELGRQRPTRSQLDRLLAVPAMAGLLAWAQKESIPIELAPELPGDSGVEGDKP